MLPSTRKSSESRAGPSSSCSSCPVRVFGDTASSLRSRAAPQTPLGIVARSWRSFRSPRGRSSGAEALRDGGRVAHLVGALGEAPSRGRHAWVGLGDHSLAAGRVAGAAGGRLRRGGRAVGRGRLPDPHRRGARRRAAAAAVLRARLRPGAGARVGARRGPRSLPRLPTATIRRARPADIELLLDVVGAIGEHQVGPPVWSGLPAPQREELRDDWVEFLEDETAVILLAERDGDGARLRRVLRGRAPWGRAPPRRRDAARRARRGSRDGARRARSPRGASRRLRDRRARLALDEPARVTLLAEARLPPHASPPAPGRPADRLMPRVPIPSGSRVAVVNVRDGVVLRPRRPSEGVVDVAAAVRDALRFPLSGSPLEALVSRGGTATLVVEAPELPLPGALGDPRRYALAAAIDELERLGVPEYAPDDPRRRRAQPASRAPRAGSAARPVVRAPLPRPGRGARRRVARPRPRRRCRPHAAARQPAAARDRPRPLRHRRRDRAPRRARRPARRLRPRDAARGDAPTHCSRPPPRGAGSSASRSSGRSRAACP